MHKFFEIAIMITIAITFVNGMIVAFSPSLIGETIALPDIRVDDANVSTLQQTENTAVPGDPLSQVISAVNGLLGTASNAVGGMALTANILFSMSIAYATVLELIFGEMGVLWVFIQWTVIPLISLMQVLSITYFLIYAISALRGGSAG